MAKTKLSVNINKIALIRNARGANFPNLIEVAQDCERFGADGVTVHPRPDERHIRYNDIPALKEVVTTEFNVEGNPTPKFLDLVLENKPHQCTLVPDAPGALTSDNGWDTLKHKDFLTSIISKLQDAGIRVSIFINPIKEMIVGAKEVGTDRIEFYTGPYAEHYSDISRREEFLAPYRQCAKLCQELGLGINAGHDLNLKNLRHFVQQVPGLQEVSIGHALVVDSLYFGLQNTIQMYQECLREEE